MIKFVIVVVVFAYLFRRLFAYLFRRFFAILNRNENGVSKRILVAKFTILGQEASHHADRYESPRVTMNILTMHKSYAVYHVDQCLPLSIQQNLSEGTLREADTLPRADKALVTD